MNKADLIEIAKIAAIAALSLLLIGICGGIERGTIPFF